MKYCIFDIETDGLLSDVTKLHCLSYNIIDEEGETYMKGTIAYRPDIIDFIKEQEVLIGHNIIRYDLPVLEKLFGIKYSGKIIDTLALSWYLYPERHKHGLESYGEEFEIPKPVINDWQSLSIQEYQHRCETDVQINTILWFKQKQYLQELYKDSSFDRIIGYLNFKFQCLLEQEKNGITLDINLCERTKLDLRFKIDEKVNILSSLMPKDIGKVLKEKPKVMYKQDSSLSANGVKWFETLKEFDLPENTEKIYERPNPCSSDQLKKWLFILGWKPVTFKVGAAGNKVPQISLPFGGGICKSVKDLYIIEPNLKELENLFLLQHRYGIIKSFIENKDENNKVYATAHGFTNTLRLKHSSPIVNLPKPTVSYGTEIRACLTVPNTAFTMFGADLSALEDSTKQHYIYFFDPEYVKEMRVPDFDPHIDIAVLGELLTQEEANKFKELNSRKDLTFDEQIEYIKLKKARGIAKTVNFAATYGAGPPKIAETAKQSLEVSKKLHEIYWKRNWAVIETAKSVRIKEVNKQEWLYNPVSGFWYYLKDEKDRFSTLNQGTGVYVFDSWLRIIKGKIKDKANIILQYHDECAGICLKVLQPQIESLIAESTEQMNKEVSLNVYINNSIDWGNNYAEVH